MVISLENKFIFLELHNMKVNPINYKKERLSLEYKKLFPLCMKNNGIFE